jgi:hypothetical protein
MSFVSARLAADCYVEQHSEIRFNSQGLAASFADTLMELIIWGITFGNARQSTLSKWRHRTPIPKPPAHRDTFHVFWV